MSGGYTISWDYYLNSIRKNRRMGEDFKDDLLKSIPTLRKNLGEDWPLEPRNSSHKILRLLRNAVFEMESGLLVFWGNCMSTAEKSEGFEGILNKIKHPCDFASSITELEMAYRLARNGGTIEFEPNAGSKKPDLLCQYGKLELFFEVKTLTTSKKTARAVRTKLGIYNACQSVYAVGRIHKSMSKQNLKKVVEGLSEKVKEAVSCRKGVEFCNNDLKVYVVPQELPECVIMGRDWLRKKAASGEIPHGSRGLSGPPDPTRPESRIKARISKIAKEQQIPPDKIGVLAIAEQSCLEDIDDGEEIVDVVTEQVNKLENILAVVLISPKLFGEVETGVTEKSNFIMIKNHLYNEIQENIVIVKNESFKPKFDYRILKSLLSYNCI